MVPKNPKFEDFFSSVYQNRWLSLRPALEVPVKHILRKNYFSKSTFDLSCLTTCDFLPGSYWSETDFHTRRDESDINIFYKMDPASVIVAQALEVKPEMSVLDMCAAPGGKSLILAEALSGTGELISNEISKDRRERLLRVFQDYIPKEVRQNIFVKGLDGNKYGLHRPNEFDAVLCDVPCSGERHLLDNATEFALWTEKRSQNLAIRQYSLLSSAWLACKLGGRIVYSTCSISPYENDQIIKKIKKRRDVQILRDEKLKAHAFIEETEFGYQVLPDTFGFGPMYFSIMLKV